MSERAGVAKATLYRHFPSKDELVLAFLRRREELWTLAWVEAESTLRGSTPDRSLLRERAEAAGLRDVDAFVHAWHLLMKGSIVAAAEGDTEAAQRAQELARLLLERHRPAAAS